MIIHQEDIFVKKDCETTQKTHKTKDTMETYAKSTRYGKNDIRLTILLINAFIWNVRNLCQTNGSALPNV